MKKILAFGVTFGVMLVVLVVSNKKPPAQPVQPPAVVVPPVGPVVPQPNPTTFEQAKAAITEAEVKQQMVYLCSPELEGRMSGMRGNEYAQKYLSGWMQQCGVGPGANGSYYQPFAVPAMNEAKERSTGKTNNVIGVLPGTDPALKDEYVVIGAHFDHIGYGPKMSSAPNRREVHPGADDNATGTVVVMSAAKGFGALKGQNRRTIVFIHFSGEEMGLVGAKHYCSNPVYPLGKTVVMINQDMVGRLNGKTTLTASGAGKVPAIAQVATGLKGYPFTLRPTNDTGGGSDHAAFAQKGVPVICFHTGQHNQYHTPDDTVDRIDFPGLHKICQAVFELAWRIDQLPGQPVRVFYEDIKEHPAWMDHGGLDR